MIDRVERGPRTLVAVRKDLDERGLEAIDAVAIVDARHLGRAQTVVGERTIRVVQVTIEKIARRGGEELQLLRATAARRAAIAA